MTGEIDKYHFDRLAEKNCIFFTDQDGRHHLLARSIHSLIPELPPHLRDYPKRRAQTAGKRFGAFLSLFHHGSGSAIPSPEHYSRIQAGFQSERDTLYILDNGSAIQLSEGERPQEPGKVLFHTSQQAARRGIRLQNLMNAPQYRPIHPNRDDTSSLYPIEGGSIVMPGVCANGGLCDMSAYHLRLVENPLSIDFVQGLLSPERHPEETRAFREIPGRLCSLTGLSFDRQAWEAAMSGPDIPLEHHCLHPFHANGTCAAELAIINLIWGASQAPYHDSYVLLLRHTPALAPAVTGLVRLTTESHPSIKLISRPDHS